MRLTIPILLFIWLVGCDSPPPGIVKTVWVDTCTSGRVTMCRVDLKDGRRVTAYAPIMSGDSVYLCDGNLRRWCVN